MRLARCARFGSPGVPSSRGSNAATSSLSRAATRARRRVASVCVFKIGRSDGRRTPSDVVLTDATRRRALLMGGVRNSRVLLSAERKGAARGADFVATCATRLPGTPGGSKRAARAVSSRARRARSERARQQTPGPEASDASERARQGPGLEASEASERAPASPWARSERSERAQPPVQSRMTASCRNFASSLWCRRPSS